MRRVGGLSQLLVALAIALLPIAAGCGSDTVGPVNAGTPGDDASNTDAEASASGSEHGDGKGDGDGGSSCDCGTGFSCNTAGRCEPSSCPDSCKSDCPQGCFDLGNCSGGTLTFVSAVETASVYGDVAGSSAAEVYYRAAGETRWWRGQNAVPITDGRRATALFDLAPDTSYDVMMRLDSVTACGSVHTLPVEPAHAILADLYVTAAAASGGDGSKSHPFATIGAALAAASPGTDIHVAAGTYHERVVTSVRGEAGHYIRILAEPGAVLDGAQRIAKGASWRTEGAEQWSIAWSASQPGYVARDDLRMYQYASLANLRSGTGDSSTPIDEGFFYDGSRLWIRSATDPSGHVWALPVYENGIALNGARYVWIEGLEIRYYGTDSRGTAIDVNNSDDIVIRHGRLHDCPNMVYIRNGSARTRVEDSILYQTRTAAWPWPAMKGWGPHENTGITVQGGSGTIVARNDIHDVFNGIYLGKFGTNGNALEDPTIAPDADVYENRLAHIWDDALELEGAVVNGRIRRNTADDVFVAISVAPVTSGPAWVLRTRSCPFSNVLFKVSHSGQIPRTEGWVFFYHNTGWSDVGGSRIQNFSHITARNNVLRSTSYLLNAVDASDNDFDHDHLWSTAKGATFRWNGTNYDSINALCTATKQECHGAVSEPKLVAPASGQCALAPNSDDVGAAERIYGINDRYRGDAPDRGFLELGDPERPPLVSPGLASFFED